MKTIHYSNKVKSHLVTIAPMAPLTKHVFSDMLKTFAVYMETLKPTDKIETYVTRQHGSRSLTALRKYIF